MSLESYLAAGRESMQKGDYAGALAQADAALAVESDSFDALQLRGRALFLLGRDEDALQALRLARAARRRQWHAEEPPPDPHEAYDEEPALAPEPVNLEALETLLALHARYHLDTELLALLGELAEDAGRYEIARDAFNELIEQEPDHLDAWEGLVHVLCHLDLDAALEAVERALGAFPRHALFLEFLGFIHYRRRRFREALHAYRQAINCGATHPDNYEAVVQCYLALNEPERAIEMLEQHARREPNDPETHRFAVEVALGSGQPDLALEHAHQLVRLEPSRAETYCYKAWVELALGDWEAASRTLRLGFHKVVDGAFALYELIDILITDGAMDEALRVAELACSLAPEHPDSLAARGKVLKEMGALDEALDAFRAAAALAPRDDVYQTWLGVVLSAQGEHQAAIKQFNYVLARRPDDLWTLANRGLAFLDMGVPERAYADFTRGLELDPEEAHLYLWRAGALARLDDVDGALRDVRQALDLSDDIFEELEHEPLLDQLRDDPRYRAMLDSESED
ncbi:MAG: lipoprotein NlpI [bacterium ADurb.Bin429]|nr:MAG: lipoprotein NlpI [bacterium ADurb.Bin429]